ncbi:MAG: hypothetical protein OEZ01_06210 [Candidatus Heimdallarchaeota archaeon]|nr:hypothetical protein [Candidatus Heimdallarchaeota archaeon]MDH5645581.1 hypothetical protein [Candidatus Heimdallarchaeota archaeon]
MVIINLQSKLVDVRFGVLDLQLKHPSLITPFTIRLSETGEIQHNNYHKIIKTSMGL